MSFYQVSRENISQYEASGKTTVNILKGTGTVISVAMTCAMIVASLIPIIYNSSYWWLQFPVAGAIFIDAIFIQPQIRMAVERREGIIKAEKKLIQIKNEDLKKPSRGDLPVADQRFKADRLESVQKKQKKSQSAKHLQRVVDVYDLAVKKNVVKVHAAACLSNQTETTVADDLKEVKRALEKAQKEFLEAVQKAYLLYPGELTDAQKLEKSIELFSIYKKYLPKAKEDEVYNLIAAFEGSTDLKKYEAFVYERSFQAAEHEIQALIAEVEHSFYRKQFNAIIEIYQEALSEDKIEKVQAQIAVLERVGLLNPKAIFAICEKQLPEDKKDSVKAKIEALKDPKAIIGIYEKYLPESKKAAINDQIRALTEPSEIVACYQKCFLTIKNEVQEQIKALKGPWDRTKYEAMIEIYKNYLSKAKKDQAIDLVDLKKYESKIRIHQAHQVPLTHKLRAKLLKESKSPHFEGYITLKQQVERDQRLQEVHDRYQGLLTAEEQAEKGKLISTALARFESELERLKGRAISSSSELFERHFGSFESENQKFIEKRNRLVDFSNKEIQKLKDLEKQKLEKNSDPKKVKEIKEETKKAIAKIEEELVADFESLEEVYNDRKIAEICKQVEEHRKSFESQLNKIEDLYQRGCAVWGSLKGFSNPPNVVLFKRQFELHIRDFDPDMSQEGDELLEYLKGGHYLARIEFERILEIEFKKQCQAWLERHPQTRLNVLKVYLDTLKEKHAETEKYKDCDAEWNRLSDTLKKLYADPDQETYKKLVQEIDQLETKVLTFYNQAIKGQASNFFSFAWQKITRQVPVKPDMPFGMDLAYFKQIDAHCYPIILEKAVDFPSKFIFAKNQSGFEKFETERKSFLTFLEENNWQDFLQRRQGILEELGEDIRGTLFDFATDQERLKLIKSQNGNLYDRLGKLMREEAKFDGMHGKLLELIETEKFLMLCSTIFENFEDELSEIIDIKDVAECRKQVTAFAAKVGFDSKNMPLVPSTFKKEMDRQFEAWDQLQVNFEWEKVKSFCAQLGIDPFENFNLDIMDFVSKQNELIAIERHINLVDFNDRMSAFLKKWKAPQALIQDWNEIITINNEGTYQTRVAAFIKKMKVDQALLVEIQEVIQNRLEIENFYRKAKIIPTELSKQMNQLKAQWDEALAAKSHDAYKKKAQKCANRLSVKEPVTLVSEQRAEMMKGQEELRKIDSRYVNFTRLSRVILRGVVITALLIVECFISNPWVPFGMACALAVLEVATYLLERHMFSLEKRKTTLKIEEYVTGYKNSKRSLEAPFRLRETHRVV